jgi:hypothetical protein
MLVDGEIGLSARNGNVRMFVNSRFYNVLHSELINMTVINRERLSTWLMVGKLEQGMR